MKDAKLKNLDITYGELIGKLGLIKWCGDSEVKEVLFIGVTPDWKYLKLMYTDTNKKYVLEITPGKLKADIEYNGDLYDIVEVFDNYITDPTISVTGNNDLKYKLLKKHLLTYKTLLDSVKLDDLDEVDYIEIKARYNLMGFIMLNICDFDAEKLEKCERHYNKTGEIKYDPS